MADSHDHHSPKRRPLPTPFTTRFASPPPRPRPLSFAEPSIRVVSPPPDSSYAQPPSFHSHSYSADYAAHPPAEPYDPYHQRGNVYQQAEREGYGEVQLEGYAGEVRYEDARDGYAEDGYEHERYGDEEREELDEKRWSEAPSAYRGRDEYGADEEKGDVVDESFDGPDWKEKEGLEEGGSPTFEGVFGAPPETAVLRRNKTKKLIKLTDGNLVIDFTIPTKLLENLPRKEGAEFTHTRVSYVTCGPEEFNTNSFALRPALYNRQTELFIVVTLYNEDEVLFCRTMHGISKNIAHLCTRNKSKTWGKDGWKKVVVCIVADGRKKVHPRVLDCLSALGVYQEGMAKNIVKNKKVEAHVYEYTTQYSLNPDLKLQSLEKGIVPTQIMFCLKEDKYASTLSAPHSHPPANPSFLSAKKLNSHRWALQAFAPQLDPNIVILIDVGTKPGPKSLYFLWKTFDLNSNVAGACGEICAMKGKAWTGLLNPLVAAQNFEYKMSNILDKPTESVFGYITVLPGAFSAYRYIALQNDALGHGPLASYFKGEKLEGADSDVFTSNMYLAEDRILCWELVAKAGHSWVLKFVKSAQGETDVPDTIVEFISQRRRWLNGSFFAGTYALTHTFQLLRTEHSFGKKLALFIQAIYNTVNLLFSWFGIANYWIFYMVLTSSLEDPSFGLGHIYIVNTIMQYCYMGTVVACFLFSMGNRPQGSKWKYMSSVVLFSITTAYMLAAAGFCIFRAVKGSTESLIYAQIIISLLATYGCYVLSSILALDPWHIVTSMGQYMLLAPFYINLLNIYAFSNLHDFSWGTKEQTTHEVDLGVAASAGKDVVDILLPSEQADIDGAYAEALRMLRTRPLILAPPKSDAQKKASTMDYYQNVRTNVLLAWCLSNALLVSTILQGDYASTFSEGGGNGRTQIYLVVVLIFVALTSLIRFVGSTAYLIIRLISG